MYLLCCCTTIVVEEYCHLIKEVTIDTPGLTQFK